ncbi:unnamed protein product [Polarella glacialis]|uniref:Uncharacterized protein n=1 Tax=Polarella glacialis TaxID=89957 RepID=A0A813KJB7_POLGL|nr:unnamed protein product [Polarella glacialis]
MASFSVALPVRRSQRIAHRVTAQESAAEEDAAGEEPAEDAAGRVPQVARAAPRKVTRTASDPEGLKVARAASKGSQDAAASQKWSLRPRQISAQRLGDTKKRQRSDVLSDDQASDFPDDVSTFSAVSAQVPGAASIISDAKASLNTWFSAQEARCQSSLQFPPRRRCSHKMRLHEVYLGREAKVREVLGRRSKTLRSIYREEVRKMRAELAEVQKRQSEEIHGLEAATGARENAAAERKRQILAHQAPALGVLSLGGFWVLEFDGFLRSEESRFNKSEDDLWAIVRERGTYRNRTLLEFLLQRRGLRSLLRRAMKADAAPEALQRQRQTGRELFN